MPETRKVAAVTATPQKQLNFLDDSEKETKKQELMGEDLVRAGPERTFVEPASLTFLRKDPVPVTESQTDVHDIAQPVDDFPHKKTNGSPKNTLINFLHLLLRFRVFVHYNVIKKHIDVIYPGKNTSIDNEKNSMLAHLYSLAALNGFPQTRIVEYLLAIADTNPFNPVLTFICSRAWDGRSRLDELIDTITVAPHFNQDLRRILIRKWLISAVAAAVMPSGFHARGVLVFQGPQGIGKTSWFRRLVSGDLEDLFREGALLDPKDKDSILGVICHWIIELGELDATFKKADIARLKAFITQGFDKVRRPYAKAEENYVRRSVFCGSVNEETFLVDSTGNSRFWVVPVVSLNYQHNIDMQQLWAEIYQMFLAGEIWWLTQEEEALLAESNAGHQVVDTIEEMIAAKYADVPAGFPMKQLTATEVLRDLNITSPTNGQAQKAGRALMKLGFSKNKTNGRVVYSVPDCLRAV